MLRNWLLSGEIEEYSTNSSDSIGVALILRSVGFDLFSVEYPGIRPFEANCRIIYTRDPIRLDHLRFLSNGISRRRARDSCTTTVVLETPEEALSVFPIHPEVANHARSAWREGSLASKSVRFSLKSTQQALDENQNYLVYAQDLEYSLQDLGSQPGRVEQNVHQIAECCFVTNQELCLGIRKVISRFPQDVISWLIGSIQGHGANPNILAIGEVELDTEQTTALCSVQAFLMGYYYGGLLPLVDTTTLACKVVDGSWGFRHLALIQEMRDFSITLQRDKFVPREKLLVLLTRFLLGVGDLKVNETGSWERKCVGFVGNRTLLCNSMLKPCRTPEDIASFTLLDVDSSGVPRDHLGLVRASIVGPEEGLQVLPAKDLVVKQDLTPSGPESDFTRHIEPDWNGNPEAALLVIRYQGRRIGVLNPAVTDMIYCSKFVKPIHQRSDRDHAAVFQCSAKEKHGQMRVAAECTLQDLLKGHIYCGASPHHPSVLIQAHNRPTMQYAAAGWLGVRSFAIASDCLHQAFESIRTKSITIIAGS